MERIVVGVDGSASAEAALRWAAAEADRHHAELTAVMAWSYLDQRRADGSEVFDASYGEDDARAALLAITSAIGTRLADAQVVCDLPARALLDAGQDADLLVVGARGLGGFKGLLLGSVSSRVLELARCPVAVVRDQPTVPSDGPVVVGHDGSATARDALGWAAQEAAVRAVALRIVHAWQVTPVSVPATGALVDALERSGHDVLDAAVADPLVAAAGVDVDGRLVFADPARGVLEHADGASLLVVGRRGLGRFGRVLLGSTSTQLAQHAPCPVVVVPQSASS